VPVTPAAQTATQAGASPEAVTQDSASTASFPAASPEAQAVGGSTAAAPGPAVPSGPELDELARVLYPKFRSRLRHELLADRERAGRLFDVK
jgi:hypothetical protein